MPAIHIFYIVFAFAGSAHTACDWQRIDGRTLTEAEFARKYFEKEPVVLTNLIGNWSALADERWSKERILGSYGDQVFDTSSFSPNNRKVHELPEDIHLQDYLNSSVPTSWFIFPHHPMIQDMRAQKDWVVPHVLRRITGDGPYISIGGKNMGNVFHNHETNWLAQVYGTKRWLITPESRPNEMNERSLNDNPCSPRPAWPHLLGCVVKPGEILYLPSQWMHETCCLDDYNVAVAYIGMSANMDMALAETNARLAIVHGNDAELGLEDYRIQNNGEFPHIHLAAHHGHEAVMQKLLRLRGNLHGHAEEQDWTPLHAAVKFGHVPLTRLLIESRAKLNVADGLGFTPYLWAASVGHVPAMQYLLNLSGSQGIDLGWRHKEQGSKAIHLAAADGHVTCVRLVLDTIPDEISSTATHRFQPLHFAAHSGHVNVARLLLQRRANVHQTSRSENEQFAAQQPLHLAAKESFARVFELLASARADLTARNGEGKTAMHLGAKQGHARVVQELVRLRVDPDVGLGAAAGTALFDAAFGGHLTVVDYLAQHRADVAAADPDRGTQPIHVAIVAGHAAVARSLLEHGADPRARDAKGSTPADYAQNFGHSEMLQFINGVASHRKKSRRRKKKQSSKSRVGEL